MSLAKELSWYSELGMFAIDRPIPISCTHQTDYCKTRCYNHKLYRIYPKMAQKDARNEEAWQAMNPEDLQALAKSLSRKRNQTKRVRLMSRGEAFSDYRDLAKVEALSRALPDTLLWVPTRAWQHPLLRVQILELQGRRKNLRILASLDPTTTREEYEALLIEGWSTMGFGAGVEEVMAKPFKCPKTHRHLKAHCATCKAGCFSPKRVDVWLLEH